MFIVRSQDSLNESRPEMARKVIKADDFWAYRAAEDAVADARSNRERILASAREAYEAEARRGYQDGTQSAKLEQSGNMIEIVGQTVDYYGRIEAQMVELVLGAVRKVVCDFDDRQRVVMAVRNCLEQVRNQKQLVITVHPDQVEFLREQVEDMRRQYPSVNMMEIRGDAKLAADACVVESDIGVVEASLAGQVEVLREALTAAFRKVPDGDD